MNMVCLSRCSRREPTMSEQLPPRGAMHRDNPAGSRLEIANAYAVGRLVERMEPDYEAAARYIALQLDISNEAEYGQEYSDAYAVALDVDAALNV